METQAPGDTYGLVTVLQRSAGLTSPSNTHCAAATETGQVLTVPKEN